MLENYSTEQMIAEWKRLTGLLPQRTDCSVELSEGSDTDAYALSEIKTWYSKILNEADPKLLPTGDFSQTAQTTERHSDGSMNIILPENCVRVLEVKLEGWDSGTRVAAYDEATAERQRHPYLRAGKCRPIAIAASDGRSVRVWPGSNGKVETLTGVARPEEGRYIFDKVLMNNNQNHDNT